MSVFVTGATGYIGRPVVEALQKAGHAVSALARSDESARAVEALGATPVRGALADKDLLARTAAESEGVVHIGMNWGPEAGEIDRAAVDGMIGALRGSGKLLLYTSGVWVMGDTRGKLAGEMAPLRPPDVVAWRPAVERMVLDAVAEKVCGVVVRPAMVYGRGGGSVGKMLALARAEGLVRVIGDGENHWSFVHVDDLADLYLRCAEKAEPGDLFVAADGPPVRLRDLAEAVRKAAGGSARIEYVPVEEARRTIGPMADALAMDQRIGSTKAARVLRWMASHPSVLEDLAAGGGE